MDAEETKVVYPKFYAAYEKASDIPTVESITAMYDRIGEILDDDKQKEFLAAAQKLVAKRIKDEEELDTINKYIAKYNFEKIDASASLNIDKSKLELQTELDDLQEKYQDQSDKLQEEIEEIKAKEEELNKQIISIKAEETEEAKTETEKDIDVKDPEKDSLFTSVAVKSIKNIGKKLWSTVSSFDFKKSLADLMDRIRNNPAASILVATISAVTVGGIVMSTVPKENNDDKQKETVPVPTPEEKEESISENETIEEDENKIEIDELYRGNIEGNGIEGYIDENAVHIRI